MAVDWEKTQLQELDITATDLSTECLMDLFTRIPNLRWLSAGQQDGFNDSVSDRKMLSEKKGIQSKQLLLSLSRF
jgi:hypothetical protein